jgi:vesicular inhibitory amino acid transporter
MLPTVFLPLSLLSYTSILGIISTFLVILVIFIDGFSVQDGPGSLWSPADTAWGIDTPTHLGIAFGLFMAGVCMLVLSLLSSSFQFSM